MNWFDESMLERLTEPQRAAVTHVDGPLLVLAGPGSGKTRVITQRIAYLIAQGIPAWSILAMTFTNKAAGEMRQRVDAMVPQEIPGRRGLTVTTFHTFCSRVLRRYAEGRLGDGSSPPGAWLKLSPRFTIYDGGDQRDAIKRALAETGTESSNFPPASVASAISKAKNQLLDAAAYAAQASDFRSRSIAKIFSAYQAILHRSDAADFDDLLLLTARMLKEDQSAREALQQRYQYILIDEYQDTNHAQFLIAHALAAGHRNICVVGDPDQCLPVGTMVATPSGSRAIETIREGDKVIAGSGWASAGEFVVDRAMSRRYAGPLVTIRTEDGLVLRATPNHMGFARIRASANLHFTYLMWKRGVGYRIGTTRGVRASKDREILSGIQVRTNQEVADAVWILRTAPTAAEARFFEHSLSVRYGIPTMVFFVRGRRMDMDQTWIDRLYREIDTTAGAERLMADLHLDRRFPHHRPGAVTRKTWSRRHVLFTMFGDNRPHTIRPWHEHRVQLVTSDLELRQRAAADGLRVRGGVRGTWRIETSRKDYDHGMALAEQIAGLDADMEIVPRARLTDGRAFHFMPLSHMHPGMVVPVLRDGAVADAVIESVQWEEYDGEVHDLSVPNARNYVAQGIVVHNSIYAWRGADLNNILEFERQYPEAAVIALGQNFRSTGHIVAAASTLIQHNRRRKHKDLHTDLGDGIKPLVVACGDEHHEARIVADELRRLHEEQHIDWREMAVLYRINALSRVMEEVLRDGGIPYLIARGTAFYDRKEIKDALAYLRLIVNPDDEMSLLRVINTPSRGISKTTVDGLQIHAMHRQLPLGQALGAVDQAPGLNARAAAAVGKFVAMLEAWRQAAAEQVVELQVAPEEGANSPLAALVERVIVESGMESALKKSRSEEDEERLENLAELISAAAQFSPANEEAAADQPRTTLRMLELYLESVALVSDADMVDSGSGAVTLMTLHAAKGLEFDAVAMIGLEDGLLPHSRSLESEAALEEERRLCFVGMTRARKHLLMARAAFRTQRGMREMTMPSGFLTELPDDSIERREGKFQGDEGFGDDPLGMEEDRPQWGRASFDAAASVVNDFPVGSLVRHPSFGLGRIESIGRQGTSTRAKVAFTRGGTKTLILEYAKLQRVD